MSSLFEKKLKKRILNLTDGRLFNFTESLSIAVIHKGKKKTHIQWGMDYKYYDLASLTKILFTVPQMVLAYEKKQIQLKDSVSQYLPWWPHKKVQIQSVLSHSAGLPWWAPFYEFLDLNSSTNARRDQTQDFLANLKLQKNKKAIYSDLDFILLGFLLEKINQESLFETFQNWDALKISPSLHFCKDNQPVYNKNLYAPTENCPWRKKVLQGEVHDDNTWAFGGVSTHAGLFGSLKDVVNMGLEFRKGHQGKNSKLGKSKTIQKFTKRAIPKTKGDWALGFMLPTKGHSSCGKYFSPMSFGHTGFTGTSLWFDPKADLLVVILSNRVHPTRENKKFVSLRPQLHDAIYEILME